MCGSNRNCLNKQASSKDTYHSYTVDAILIGVIERSVIADIHTAPSEQQATPTGMHIHPEFGWFSL